MIQTVFKILTSNDLSRIILVSKYFKRADYFRPVRRLLKGGGGAVVANLRVLQRGC